MKVMREMTRRRKYKEWKASVTGYRGYNTLIKPARRGTLSNLIP